MECWRETEMNHIGKIASARWQQGGGRGGLWGRQEERLWEAGQNVFLSVVPSPTEAKNEVKQRAIDDDGDGWETTNSASHAARLAVSVSKDEFFSLSLFVFGGGSCDFFSFFFFSLYRAPNGSNCWLAAGRIPDTAIGWVMPPIWKGAPVEDIMGRIPEAIIGWKKIQKFHCRRDFFQRGGWGGLGSYYIPPRLLHDSLIQWTLINGISLQGKPDSSR